MGLIQGTVSQNADRNRSFIYWQEISVDTENNRSLVRVIPIIDTLTPAYDWNGTASGMTITINGTPYSYGNFNSNTDSGWTYSLGDSPTGRVAENIIEQLSPAYKEVYVDHNEDGSKDCSISMSFSLPSAGFGPGNVSASGTATLTLIPRGILHTKVSGIWKQGLTYVKVSGVWKQAIGVYTKVSGVWKQSI